VCGVRVHGCILDSELISSSHRVPHYSAPSRLAKSQRQLPSAMSIRTRFFVCCFLLCLCPVCQAGQFKVSSNALERTLKSRLFNTPDGRYYLRGDAHSVCNLYVEDPHLSFAGDRILVRVHTGGTYGKQLAGRCLGFHVSMNTTISLAPLAQGETIGVTDARVDRLSDSSELNFILSPFLSRNLPANIQLNAANMLREILTKSTETSGYPLTLERLDVRHVHATDKYLSVEYDSDMRVE
jgi:hypothetical protein